MLTIFLLMLLASYITGVVVAIGVGLYYAQTQQGKEDRVTRGDIFWLSLASWFIIGVFIGALGETVDDIYKEV